LSASAAIDRHRLASIMTREQQCVGATRLHTAVFRSAAKELLA